MTTASLPCAARRGRKSSAWYLSLCMSVLLVGCGSVAPLPDDHHYRLPEARVSRTLAEPTLDGTLRVEPLKASGVRRGRAILYSEAPYLSFREYHFHHWEEPPPRLFQRRLVEGLSRAGVAERVTDDGAATAAYRIDAEILRFERLLDAGSAAAIVEVDFRVVADSAEMPLLERTYRVEQPATTGTMAATIQAFGLAIDDVIARLTSDLAAVALP